MKLNSIIGSDQYVIQGRPVPFDPTDVVPLNFRAGEAGNFTIAIDHVGGLFSGGQSIYLRDTVTGTVHDLTAGSYTFSSTNGSFPTRFELLYQQPLGTNTPTFNEGQVVLYPNATNDIVVNTGNVIMDSIKVFNVRGQLLSFYKGINSSQSVISIDGANQVLLVQITSQDGIQVTKKYVR